MDIPLHGEIWGASMLRHRTSIFLCLMFSVFAFCLGAAAPSARAAGVTTHWYMGALVIDHLDDKNLANLLKARSVWYRRGTTFPDAAIEHLKHIKASDADQDNLTHNDVEKGKSGKTATGGFFTRYLEGVIQTCGGGKNMLVAQLNLTSCQESLAFFFGMVNHVIADAPWHGEFIGDTTGKYCPDVKQVWGEDEDRHGIADTDFDICLSSRLHGNKKDISNIISVTGAEKTSHKIKLLCNKGEFYSPAKGGRCFKCPSGMSPSGALGDSSKACVETKHAKPNRHGAGAPGCPIGSGQWLSAIPDYHCYTCPGGYTHDNTKTAADTGVCFKKEHKKAADKGKPGVTCNKGEFADILYSTNCYKCPSGYTPNSGKPAIALDKCEKHVSAPCSDMDVTSHGLPITVVASADMLTTAVDGAPKLKITELLTKAYKADGETMDVDAINKAMDGFYKKALSEPLATFSDVKTRSSDYISKKGALTKYAGSCKGLFENGIGDVPGGVKDSAAKAANAINVIWKALKEGQAVKFVRTGSFNYRVYVKEKQAFCYGGC